MQTIQIKHRYTGSVLFEHSEEVNSVLITIKQAISVRANLEGANLRSANLVGADLEGANLRSANLVGANLVGADLEGANLRSANLVGADLEGANLRSANLVGANLVGANLEGANLRSANLVGADLEGANLVGADLEGANLRPIKHDLFGVLLYAQHEVSGLLAALKEGRVNGSVYQGDCACLVGTICNIRKVSADLSSDVLGLPKASNSAIEKWFLGIRPDDTPDNSPIVKLTVDWVEEFVRLTTPIAQ